MTRPYDALYEMVVEERSARKKTLPVNVVASDALPLGTAIVVQNGKPVVMFTGMASEQKEPL